jgi:hypothetical protein
MFSGAFGPPWLSLYMARLAEYNGAGPADRSP